MIVTESSLKLWVAYDNIDAYVDAYKECGYEFSVTKISPRILDEQRELNYQYLQSYEFTDEDIAELCTPTIKYLKDAMCGDYSSTIKFLGITDNSDVQDYVLRTIDLYLLAEEIGVKVFEKILYDASHSKDLQRNNDVNSAIISKIYNTYNPFESYTLYIK